MGNRKLLNIQKKFCELLKIVTLVTTIFWFSVSLDHAFILNTFYGVTHYKVKTTSVLHTTSCTPLSCGLQE
jgi:hypothetical protein